MQTFRLMTKFGCGHVRYSRPLGMIDALKTAVAVKRATGTEPEIVPNTRTLRRKLAALDASAADVLPGKWAELPAAAIPETRPGGFMGLLWGFWDWLVGSLASH